MNKSFETDWATIGLNYGHGHNAFTACTPRSTKTFTLTAPKKRGPRTKQQRLASSLTSDEERAVIRSATAKQREALARSIGSTPSRAVLEHDRKPIHYATGAMRTM